MPFYWGIENTMRDDIFLKMIHPSGLLLYINQDKLRIFAYIMVLYMQVLNAWSIHHLLNNFDLFLQYNSLLLAQQLGLSCAVYLTISYRHTMRFKNRIAVLMWPLDICGEKTCDRILGDVRFLKYKFLLIILCTLGGHALFMPFVGDESEIFIAIKLIDDFFEGDVGTKATLSVIFYVGILFLGMSVGGVVMIFIYFSVHLETAFHLLNLKVKNISKGLGHVDEDGFQDDLGARLRFCIDRHITLLQLFNSMDIIHNNWPVLIFSLTGVLTIVSEIYLLLADISSKSNIRLIVAMLTSVYIAYQFVKHGQQLKDEYMKLHQAAQNCSWHGWSKQNINYLRMILMNSSKPIKITSYDMVDLDYTLSVKMTKIVYSILTALMNLKADKK